MMEFSVGKPLKLMRNMPEGCIFFVHDAGMFLIVNFLDPTPEEIKQVSSGADFEMRWTILNGIIIITAKMGSLNWMDAPFSPQIEIENGHLHLGEKLTGSGLTLIMTDARNAIVKEIRIIGLSANFLSSLYDAMRSVANEPITENEYNRRINLILARYATADLVRMGEKNLFRLKDMDHSGDNPELRKSLQDIAAFVSKRPCPSLDIPTELQPYHYYIADSGHCITAIPKSLLPEAQASQDMNGYEVPVPCKYVLEKGWEITNGYIVVDVPYDNILGLVVDDKYCVY